MKEKRSKCTEYLKLNKNLFIAYTTAFIIATITAQLFSNSINYLNTSVTMLTENSAYFSAFGLLHSIDNRKKYRIETGEIDWSRLRKDLIKILTSLGIGEIVYTILRWFSQYYLLTLNYQPYLASMISDSISFMIYLVVVNLSVKMTKLF
ncbi:MAG: hypothetical protein E6L00_06810 [Thaumarchaeota archaeon]|nr:MAG: hypothetical protein E6L00_06810 [Nitrososphaerota archaeon]